MARSVLQLRQRRGRDRSRAGAGPSARGAGAGPAVRRTDEYPYIAEIVAGHVAKVGYEFGQAFEYGLDLILDAREARRESA